MSLNNASDAEWAAYFLQVISNLHILRDERPYNAGISPLIDAAEESAAALLGHFVKTP